MESAAPRVVFGQTAPASAFPFYARLGVYTTDNQYLCGASLVTPTTLLTAAHCLPPETVLVEAWMLFTEEHVTFHPGDWRISEAYDGSGPGDIAALYVRRGSLKATPIPVAPPKPDALLHVVGVGEDEWGQSGVLRMGRVSETSCAAWGANVVSGVDLCALGACDQDGCVDACAGDSGGPLLDRARGELVGVVSRGPRPCGGHPEYPGIYTIASQHPFLTNSTPPFEPLSSSQGAVLGNLGSLALVLVLWLWAHA